MSVRSEAWALFDALVNGSSERDTNPWRLVKYDSAPPAPLFAPDYDTLTQLLSVPIYLGANSQSGVPALAFDVWVAYEFRRAGFDPDAIWPRPLSPRVLPPDVAAVLANLPARLRSEVAARLTTGGLKGVVGANATILGKNYVKQVDVGMSSWRTGPELLVSTKRMDSSFAKNAANRVEESYGDAKNLRLRHPRAALGFVYGLRSIALSEEPDKTDWLRDLLAKLGREDDAYDAVALVIPEWATDGTPLGAKSVGDGVDDSPAEDALVGAGLGAAPAEELDLVVAEDEVLARLRELPDVALRHDEVPYELSPGRFFEKMTTKILDNCPVNFHVEARHRYNNPVDVD